MSSSENIEQPLATADQISALLTEVDNLTSPAVSTHGIYELRTVDAPREVAVHFPDPGQSSVGERTSMRISRQGESPSDQERRSDIAATISFLYRNYSRTGVKHITQLDYSISSAGVSDPPALKRRTAEYDSRLYGRGNDTTISNMARLMVGGTADTHIERDQDSVSVPEADSILLLLKKNKNAAARDIGLEFMDTLKQAAINPRRVSLDRQLVSRESATEHGVIEIIDQDTRQRYVVAKNDNHSVSASMTLEENGVPVIRSSDQQIEGLHLWEIPTGSTTLRSVISDALYNPDRYGELLAMASDIMRKVDENGLSIVTTQNRGLLDHVIIVPDIETGYRPVLVPPVQVSSRVDQSILATNILRDEISALVEDEA